MTPGTNVPTREFERNIHSLGEIFGFLDESFDATTIDDRTRMVLQLAVEELFTNMVKYNSKSPSRIAVRIAIDGDQARVQLTDPDTEPFNLLEHGPVDTTRPIEERRRGGLGIHLVKAMADHIDHRYQGREMTISVTKRLE